MASSLAGKVAVVTGASSGIGWALAKELAAEGCRVGLIARRAEPLQALAAEIAAAGGKAVPAAADVGRREQVAAAVESVRAALGPIDLVIANAGIGRPTLLDPVNVYMDGLRIHLRGSGLRATTICPGFVKTPMTASNRFHMPQLMEADYAARRIVRAVLTPEGRERAAAGADAVGRVQEAFAAALPSADRAALAQVLATLA